MCIRDSYHYNEEYHKAKKYFEVAIEHNNYFALVYLGILYQYGDGVPRDVIKAEKLYKKAYKLGDINAIYNLSKLFKIHNFEKAEKYYREAVNLHMGYMYGKLAKLYQKKILFGKDNKYSQEAVKLWKTAIEKGYKKYLYNLGAYYTVIQKYREGLLLLIKYLYIFNKEHKNYEHVIHYIVVILENCEKNNYNIMNKQFILINLNSILKDVKVGDYKQLNTIKYIKQFKFTMHNIYTHYIEQNFDQYKDSISILPKDLRHLFIKN